MGTCNGNCGGCAGCARELVLTQAEIDFLKELGAVAFLPIARSVGDDIPVYPEVSEDKKEEYSLLLQVLEKKGLISLDYDKPLKGYPLCAGFLLGSMALTERGGQVLELLEYQGIEEESKTSQKNS